MKDIYVPPPELVLGTQFNSRVPEADQKRQREEVTEILRRLRKQPGMILADEVGMGKTFVAMAVAYSVAMRSPRGPVILMVPANLVDKWEQDLKTFCELYLKERYPVRKNNAFRRELRSPSVVRYEVARHGVELMRLLDDKPAERCHLIFLAHGSMSRQQTDIWLRLALIAKTLTRHGTGKANRLIQVKKQIHRFLAKLLWGASGWKKDLWEILLKADPETWKDKYNDAIRDEHRKLTDDPVPKSMLQAIYRIDLRPLAEALKQMPVRASGSEKRLNERLETARRAMRKVEEDLWKDMLIKARWRSPLLVMDEAHHLKNPGTALARQLQSADSKKYLQTGDGAMAKSFDRMLFLTATPFQLGHHELVSVLQRFGDVRWDPKDLGNRESFDNQLKYLAKCLDDSQRSAIALQRGWSRLLPEDCGEDIEIWWKQLCRSPRESLTNHQRAVIDAFETVMKYRDEAQKALRPWLLRHNKGTYWHGTDILRRERIEGAAINGSDVPSGLRIPPQQMLPFFLAARSAVDSGKDLLGEALCSSYEAFRNTRRSGSEEKDTLDSEDNEVAREKDFTNSRWYLQEFDRSLGSFTGAIHPKIEATVRKVADLWERGEKVLVFAFYRKTCRGLRIHISREIERRVMEKAIHRLSGSGMQGNPENVNRVVEIIQRRFFDSSDSPGRRSIDAALYQIIETRSKKLGESNITGDHREKLVFVMRRFLRVPTTLIRCFPIVEYDSIPPEKSVQLTLDFVDSSGLSWRDKMGAFIDFLTRYCSMNEREIYLNAAQDTQTGDIRVAQEEDDDLTSDEKSVVIANVRVTTGETRRDLRNRLMLAFNTPFFPDILVSSQVMGEGVDLQRYCRHVIHHDLAWNPSTIEQRTGRIDRLGCKAEGHHPVVLYLPYLAGTADERQFNVMSDRERWFRIVMGQDEVARLITTDTISAVPLPEAISNELSFKLGLNA